ncbi:hypothetical protein D1164_22320 [Mariniphaga sediminis]|uniref:DUF5615 domain-containing protein n=1 Tax=Mariniphaga sediminis TaxID=1628158 RepID=A0A399CWT9_9BACT|nr:DUF5615 family PIN-like protein [Mariniphaga sediminis]RIH62952.1 hypothetical protein D1164_22320 [Mariniphaga sediminis]
MFKFLIDENLPYYFELWNNENFIHVNDLPNISSDEDIWKYSEENNMVIITKDADFSNKILYKTPPPKVIHLKIGNKRMSELHAFLNRIWPSIQEELKNNKLINVFPDRIESLT